MEGGFVIIQGDDMLGKAVNVLEGLGWGRRSVCRSLSSATAIVPHRFPSKATLTLSLIAGHQRPVAILLSSPLIIYRSAFSFTWEAMPSENCYYCSNSREIATIVHIATYQWQRENRAATKITGCLIMGRGMSYWARWKRGGASLNFLLTTKYKHRYELCEDNGARWKRRGCYLRSRSHWKLKFKVFAGIQFFGSWHFLVSWI